MTGAGRILIADGDAPFAASAGALLHADGFEVDVAGDGATAATRIAEQSYDLVISGLETPGNEELRLVREVARRAAGLPVVVVTGSPSAETAIAAIGLNVSAYLLKPVNDAELRTAVLAGVARYRSWQAMRGMERRLAFFQKDVDRLVAPRQEHCGTPLSVDAFMALTLRNVMGSLADLEHLNQALCGGRVEHPCQLMNCPRGRQLQEAVTEAIAALEETKTAFKSRTLATLRQRLEAVLAQC